MTPLILTDIVRFAHILAVAIGLGAAFLADFYTLSRIRSVVTTNTLEILENLHNLICCVLGAMWITGGILIYLRTGFIFENFTPKLFTKIFVVTVLTINALLIGWLAMPTLLKYKGKPLLSIPAYRILPMTMVGAVSSVSWLLALALGISKTLAASDSAILLTITSAAYLIASITTVTAVGCMLLLLRLLTIKQARKAFL